MEREGVQVADSEAQMVEATLRALLAEVLGISA
jgi:hypothetical protein